MQVIRSCLITHLIITLSLIISYLFFLVLFSQSLVTSLLLFLLSLSLLFFFFTLVPPIIGHLTITLSSLPFLTPILPHLSFHLYFIHFMFSPQQNGDCSLSLQVSSFFWWIYFFKTFYNIVVDLSFIVLIKLIFHRFYQ